MEESDIKERTYQMIQQSLDDLDVKCGMLEAEDNVGGLVRLLGALRYAEDI